MKSVLLRISLVLLLTVFASSLGFALDPLVKEGLRVFTEETFGGNGRTCSTCHRLERNTTIDPEFIATLPPNDPLFIAENDPALAELENSVLLREYGLFKTSADPAAPNFRSTSHTLGMRQSIDSTRGPALGWSGVSSGDGTLREFAFGAVEQHHTKTMARVEGVDFRLPTDDELDAMEAFQLWLGRQEDVDLPLNIVDSRASQGQALFLDDTITHCFFCHNDAGAKMTTFRNGVTRIGNETINTGVEMLSQQISALTGVAMPVDIGEGVETPPRAGRFNITSVIEAADTTPLFHNHGAQTLRDSIAFYASDDFNNSPGADVVGTISLTNQQVADIAAFLTVLNADENLRQAIVYLQEGIIEQGDEDIAGLMVSLAIAQLDDVIKVLDIENLYSNVQQQVLSSKLLLETTGEISALTEQITVLMGLRNLMIANSSSNQPPVVNAGSDQTIVQPNLASLAATVSDDGLPVGSSVTVNWSQVSGPGIATFTNAASTITTVGFSTEGSYILRLIATDSQLSGSADITVTVTGATTNQPPVVVAGANQTLVLPDLAILSGVVSDDGLPVGSSLTLQWSLVSGPDAVVFSDDSSVETTASLPQVGDYILRLTATDSLLSSHSDIFIEVVDVVQDLSVSSVSPAVLTAGSTTAVTISGAGFVEGAAVRMCRSGVTFGAINVINSNTIQVDAAVASTVTGSCGVRVTNPNGDREFIRNVITIVPN